MLFTAAEYRSMREEYCYYDRDCRFKIVATTFLDSKFIGEYKGIFPKAVPPTLLPTASTSDGLR